MVNYITVYSKNIVVDVELIQNTDHLGTKVATNSGTGSIPNLISNHKRLPQTVRVWLPLLLNVYMLKDLVCHFPCQSQPVMTLRRETKIKILPYIHIVSYLATGSEYTFSLFRAGKHTFSFRVCHIVKRWMDYHPI